jgi:transposase-like protein
MPAKKDPTKTPDLTAPLFTDEAKAREHLEAIRWPDGPVCPHCGENDVTRLDGEAHRPGLIQCNACREQFSVTVGTLFERSHLPLHKWLLAFHLMASSKKGMSAHQMHRMLDITYKTAWFMCHRIREAMKTTPTSKLGGRGKTLEADETFWGQRPTAPGTRKPRGGYQHKNAIVSLVERGGDVRTFHVPNATAGTVRRVLDEQADKQSHLMTDEAKHYRKVGREFANHSAVNHTRKEYVRGEAHTNTVESYFSILKRGLVGTFHHVGVQHLQRYVCEFDFRYNHRKVWDDEKEKFRPMTDVERAISMLHGIDGKRLTYRRING